MPYFPNKSQKVFNGVYGYAVYSCVFYLFVDLKSFSKKSLENTVVHELNHTIYFYRHFDGFGNYTLLDNLILEGLAENFRKDVLGGVLPPWTKSLDKTESLNILSDYTSILMSKDLQLINDFLFGSKKFKKWTGYSAGFHLVREFIKCNPNFSWEKIMKTKIKEFQNVFDELATRNEKLAELILHINDESKDVLTTKASSSLIILLSVIATSVIISLLLGFYIANVISKPLQEAVEFTNKILNAEWEKARNMHLNLYDLFKVLFISPIFSACSLVRFVS